MPYGRLMYDGDNNYTKKEKRMILLTQEAIDKINGLTPGGGAGATFVTQEEYDALPSSKLTDGIEYIIVDTHCDLMTYPELFQLEINNNVNTVLTELNSCADGYRKKLSNNGLAYIQDGSDYATLPAGKHLYGYFMFLSSSNGRYVSYDTDMTAQELNSFFSGASAQTIQSVIDGERLYSGATPIEMRGTFLSDNEVKDGNK